MTDKIALNSIPARSDDALYTDTDSVTVLMSMESGRFVELNHTARAIWDLTNGEASVGEIVDTLSGRFDVSPEECRADVTDVYARLREEGMVVFDD